MDSCFQQMLPPSSKALTYMYVFSDEYTNFLHDDAEDIGEQI